MKLKIEKTKVFKKKDKPWVAKLENEKPDQAILVGYSLAALRETHNVTPRAEQ